MPLGNAKKTKLIQIKDKKNLKNQDDGLVPLFDL